MRPYVVCPYAVIDCFFLNVTYPGTLRIAIYFYAYVLRTLNPPRPTMSNNSNMSILGSMRAWALAAWIRFHTSTYYKYISVHSTSCLKVAARERRVYYTYTLYTIYG